MNRIRTWLTFYTLDMKFRMDKGDEANVLDAAAKGASTAIMLVLNIGGSLIAFLAFVGFLNAIVGKIMVS